MNANNANGRQLETAEVKRGVSRPGGGVSYPRRVSVDIKIVVAIPIMNAIATHAAWPSVQKTMVFLPLDRARSSLEMCDDDCDGASESIPTMCGGVTVMLD